MSGLSGFRKRLQRVAPGKRGGRSTNGQHCAQLAGHKGKCATEAGFKWTRERKGR